MRSRKAAAVILPPRLAGPNEVVRAALARMPKFHGRVMGMEPAHPYSNARGRKEKLVADANLTSQRSTGDDRAGAEQQEAAVGRQSGRLHGVPASSRWLREACASSAATSCSATIKTGTISTRKVAAEPLVREARR
jgi:hypothetical protein